VNSLHQHLVRQDRRATGEPRWVKALLIAVLLAFVAFFLLLPLSAVFIEAFSKGVRTVVDAFLDEGTVKAIELTLLVAAIAVPLNTVFGLAASWALAQFRFPGRQLILILIDLPLWVSPVIGGMIYVLLFGRQGPLWTWLDAHNLRIVFALPGIVLGTTFVTFPFVARNVIPLMETQGKAEEEAALSLGARGWQVFLRVTLPKVKWALIYGVILCNARAMGEFGAVSVVSGHIRGQTNTMPLQVEILYNEYHFAAAFAVAALLSLLALVTLGIKTFIEWRAQRELVVSQSTPLKS
jgi:sulfate transport system permease protein